MPDFFTSCFWAFLKPEQLQFLYVSESARDILIQDNKSIQNLLLHRSLYEFIHPDELPLAQKDLAKFMKVNALAGSITRCRLRSFISIATLDAEKASPMPQRWSSREPASDNCTALEDKTLDDKAVKQKEDALDNSLWDIVDVVMYTATENVILAFFHNSDARLLLITVVEKPHSRCRSRCKKMCEIKVITDALEAQVPSREPPAHGSIRVFQIYDNKTGTLILSWPSRPSDLTPSETGQGYASDQTSATNTRAIDNVPNFDTLLNEAIALAGETIRKEFFVYGMHSGHQQPERHTASWLSSDSIREKEIACTHHIHTSSIVTLFNSRYRFERIIIPYGAIIFNSFQMTPIGEPYVKPASGTLASHSTYHHYMHCSTPDENVVSILSAAQVSPQCAAHVSKTSEAMLSESHAPVTASATTAFGVLDDRHKMPRYGNDAPTHVLTQLIQDVGPTPGPSEALNRDRSLNFSAPLDAFTSRLGERQILSGTYERTSESTQPSFTYNTAPYRSDEGFKRRREIPHVHQSQSLPLEDTDDHEHGGSSGTARESRVCSKCRTSSSPEWRRGPTGHKTLCNACGLRYSRLVAKQKRQTQQHSFRNRNSQDADDDLHAKTRHRQE